MADLISVIIPVYNTAKFLKQCIKSVLSQDYREIEIIIINDASTDKSLKICFNFKNKDSRIKIINKIINEGVEKARLDGLNISQGKFVFFLDSDDWLYHNKVLSFLYKKSVETNADYVQIGAIKVLDRFGIIRRDFNEFEKGIFESPHIINNFYISFFGHQKIDLNIWGKLYKASTLKKIPIKCYNYIYQQDLIFNMQIFPFLKKIIILDEIGYCYRWGGMTKQYNPKKFEAIKSQYILKKNIIDKKNLYHFDKYLNDWFLLYLESEIRDRIRYLKYKINDLQNYINIVLQEPYFRYLENGIMNENNKEFISKIINKEISWIYTYIYNKNFRNINKIKFLTFIEKIIRNI